MSLDRDQRIVAMRAIDLLVEAEPRRANIESEAAWTKAVRNRLRGEHWQTITDLLDADPAMTSEGIADRLGRAQGPGTGTEASPVDLTQSAAARLMAENAARLAEVEQLPRSAKEHARARIAEIRASLRGTP